MATELEDPFRDLSSFSLLSQTLAPVSLDPERVDSIQDVFKSMAIKGSSRQLMEQANTIMNSYKDFEGEYTEDGNEPVALNDKNRALERRPALGRKRAKFSLKPTPSHPIPSIDMRSNIDHLEDPEEYFLAIDQFENADKELKKLRGETSADLIQHSTTTARKRRPGLLGRRVSYKHQFSTSAVTSEAFVESQEEPIDGRISSPLKDPAANIEFSTVLHSEATKRPGTSHTNVVDDSLQDATGAGLLSDTQKETDNVLDNLLSSFEDLDGDEGETLLRQSLQIKSIDIGKICLPDLSTKTIDHNTVNSRDIIGQLKGFEFSQISPTMIKSPFPAIAALQRRSSLKSSLKGLYSASPSDYEPPSGDSSMSGGVDRVSLSPLGTESLDKNSLVVSGAISPVTKTGLHLSPANKTHRPLAEADEFISQKTTLDKELPVDRVSLSPLQTESHDESDLVVSGAISPVIRTGVHLSPANKPQSPVSEAYEIISDKSTAVKEFSVLPTHSLDQNTDHCSDGGDGGKDIISSELDVCVQQEGNRIELDPSVSNQPNVGVGGLNSSYINDTRIEDMTSPSHSDMGKKCSSSGTSVDSLFVCDDTSHIVENAVQEQTLNVEAVNDSSTSPKTTLVMDQRENGLSTLQNGNNEGQQTASGASLNRRRNVKAVARRRNKKSSISKRESLADAGTLWNSGVRRSSRIRSRPLEYWRGERFVYGRIHDSLATVIGVKYASPGDQQLKVKSFVSDNYADLVAQSASY